MKRSIQFLRVGVAAILFVMVLELCARLDDYLAYRAPLLGTYSDNDLYENDQLGKRGKPFARYRKWQLNEYGYRGPRVDPGRIHIAAFGASETFGLYESEDQEYPRQLERELNARAGAPLYQVINVAYPGQTLPTATERVPEIAARLHPQIALIYSTPTFYIDMPPKRSGRHVRAAPPPAFEWRISERLQNVAKAVLPEAVQTWLREWQIERTLKSKEPIDRMPEETVNRFKEDMTELVSVLRANNVEPAIVTHATVFGSGGEAADRAGLVAWRKFHPQLKEEGLLDLEHRINQAMRDVAAEQHVILVDVAREIPPDKTYFADFVHFTDAGGALMAKRLADGIGPLLARPADSPYLKSADTSTHNDHTGVVTR